VVQLDRGQRHLQHIELLGERLHRAPEPLQVVLQQAGRTARWCCAGWPPGWARPPSSSAGVNGYLHLPALRSALEDSITVTPAKEDAA
jgi:hypothetical protein